MGDLRNREYRRFTVREVNVRALVNALERMNSKRPVKQLA